MEDGAERELEGEDNESMEVKSIEDGDGDDQQREDLDEDVEAKKEDNDDEESVKEKRMSQLKWVVVVAAIASLIGIVVLAIVSTALANDEAS